MKWLCLILCLGISSAGAQTNVFHIDLPSALRLAGTNNLDVRTALERNRQAQAQEEAALWRFFPSIHAGAGYRWHDHRLQDAAGNILDVEKQSYSLGPTISGEVRIGEAIYDRLAARQLARAAAAGAENQKLTSQWEAANAYIELVRSSAALEVSGETWRISTNYAGQLQRAFAAGIAFQGDVIRAGAQAERNLAHVQSALEARTRAGLRLAEVLRLDLKSELAPADSLPVPLRLLSTNQPLEQLVADALASHPELRQARFLEEAATQGRKAARYGPWVPTAGASVFGGAFGGGKDGRAGGLAESEEAQVTLGWRIGPGGLFDKPRQKLADSRWREATLAKEKISQRLEREVRESHSQLQSLANEVATLQRSVESAQQMVKLMRQRREVGVGVVLETIQSEQDLARFQLDLLSAISEYNRTQVRLLRSLGKRED
jgi:outer membrane protein TolC